MSQSRKLNMESIILKKIFSSRSKNKILQSIRSYSFLEKIHFLLTFHKESKLVVSWNKVIMTSNLHNVFNRFKRVIIGNIHSRLDHLEIPNLGSKENGIFDFNRRFWIVRWSLEGNGQFGVPKGCVSLHLLTSVPNKNVLFNSLYDLLSKIIGTVSKTPAGPLLYQDRLIWPSYQKRRKMN